MELIHDYAGRKVWLVEPDMVPARVSSYPILSHGEVSAHEADSWKRAREGMQEFEP